MLLSVELPAPHAPQLRVKVMGEELLAFCDSDGRNEQCGIRCAFHGWKFNVDGECADIPSADLDVAPGMALGTSLAAEQGERYWRIAQYLMPCHRYTPSAMARQTYHAQSWARPILGW